MEGLFFTLKIKKSMQSFRTELENPVVEKDIIELENKIRLFKEGKLDEEKFRSLRLARGIYGQRQPGVQMIRIKIPYGKLTSRQLNAIADISDKYSNGKLHITTRQDLQIHYVSLDQTPELWSELEASDITLREACGNTVRNITASENAGVHPNELFDVTPYAHATFKYFLRNPVQQELGRKFKMAFSATDEDTAFSYIHDLGFIPRIENGNRGFKVLLGGGLGAQPSLAEVAYEFLPEENVIPFIEALIRFFDRNGERNRRHKARLKYILKDLGIKELLNQVEEFRKASKVSTYPVPFEDWKSSHEKEYKELGNVKVDEAEFSLWKATNTFEQKQKGFYGVYAKVPLGNFTTQIARQLADLVDNIAADDIRLTIGQNLLLKFIRPEHLKHVYHAFKQFGWANAGHNSVADITSCPGTDTCNLGISNSTNFASNLESIIDREYKELLTNNEIKIKISGCMNSCGQHGLAHIGWHGSSMKNEGKVLPALQILLGGGTLGAGEGRVGQKVIKIPSKRGGEALRTILNDYQNQAQEGEYFLNYFDRQGKDYFYQILKPLANLDTLTPADYVDWGHDTEFATAVGVGECAGVVVDLVATLVFEAEEKLAWAKEAIDQGQHADGIYHAYGALISGAKALLLKEDVKTNTHKNIIQDFDEHFTYKGLINLSGNSFESLILQLDKNDPSEQFAEQYFSDAAQFLEKVNAIK